MKIKFSLCLFVLFILFASNLWAGVPQVVSSIPANGDLTADPDTPCIEVTFSETMTGSGNWSFSSTDLTGQWSWSNDRKTFRYCRNNPQNPLPVGSYWFKLNPPKHPGFKSNSTQEPLPTTTISFTVTADGHNDGPNADVTPPRVTGSTPANHAINISSGTTCLEITFNEDMDTTVTEAWSSSGKAATFWGDELTSTISWPNARTLKICRHSRTFLEAGDYAFTLNPNGTQSPFTDKAGNALPRTTISFSVSLPVTNAYTYYVPYFQSGNGYWTGLCVSNISDKSADVTIALFDSAGDAYNNLTQTFEIVKNGQHIGVVAPGENASGWIRIASTDKLSGSCFLGSSQMADIPFVSKLGKTLVVAQVAQDNLWDTKIMVCNPNCSQSSLTLTYYSKTGLATTTPEKTLPEYGSAVYHLSDIFPNMTLDAGKVIISVTQGGGIAAFALYYDTEHGGNYFAGINADIIN